MKYNHDNILSNTHPSSKTYYYWYTIIIKIDVKIIVQLVTELFYTLSFYYACNIFVYAVRIYSSLK